MDFEDQIRYTLKVKQCVRCKKIKSLEEFNFKFKSLGIRQKTCKTCTRREVRNHYNNNRDYYLHKAKKRNSIIRKQNREYVLNYLLKYSCVDCGENDPVFLEFDHSKNKISDISHLIKNSTIKKIEEEMKKCEVRCANCHRRKTARNNIWYRNRLPL